MLVWDQNIETMKTTEQLAEERYPYSMQRLLWSKTDKGRHEHGVDLQRLAYATCIREEVEPLEVWKESAIKVMGEWDKVWTALGNPGKLGESTATASLAEVVRLRALVQRMVNGLEGLVYLEFRNSEGLKSGAPTAKEWLCAFDDAQKCIDTANELGFVPTNTEDK